MGYFQHKLDRARRGAAAHAARRRQSRALVTSGAVFPPSDGDAVPVAGYRRYAVPGIDPDSQHHRGIFVAAGELERSGELWDHEFKRLRRALTWFNTNLCVPKGVSLKAIYWFKPSATACHWHAYEIIRLLQAYGHNVWMLEARRPGRILYEDELQIGALPYAAKEWAWTEPTWPWAGAGDATAAARPAGAGS